VTPIQLDELLGDARDGARQFGRVVRGSCVFDAEVGERNQQCELVGRAGLGFGQDQLQVVEEADLGGASLRRRWRHHSGVQ